MQKIIIIFLLIFFGLNSMAQEKTLKTTVPDSIIEKQHSPGKATIMSLCLPGLGQIYNKKIWKVPIIYAGFGVLTYFIVFNTNYYLTYKSAYIESFNKDSSGNYSEIVRKYTADNILSAREYYRRDLEISIIFTALWYVLNVVDAAVDAHLFTFNISKDLSLKVEPVVIPQVNLGKNYSSGFRIRINF